MGDKDTQSPNSNKEIILQKNVKRCCCSRRHRQSRQKRRVQSLRQASHRQNPGTSWLRMRTRTLSPFFNHGVMPQLNNPTLTPPKPKENWLKLLLIVWKLAVSRDEFLPLIPIRTENF